MAKLYFKYGAMGSSKTAQALITKYNYEENDLRVWLLGGEIYAACLRRSATDFRSNYCLGGSAAVYPLTPAERAQVSDIAALVQADYYAIDFVRHQGRWVFNELEDTVGARMLYDLTSLDPLADYCRYIQNCL